MLLALVLLGVVVLGLTTGFGCTPSDETSGQTSTYNVPLPQSDLQDVEKCDGSWALCYQKAAGQSKQALELLFRCHIIPVQEFSHSRVSQEHIDECVWIATHMLRQRTLA